MNISLRLDQLHLKVRNNRWIRYFAVFNRVALAAGFIPSGLVKIMGERFTALSANHPMGHYLEALHKTGYYYPFIGVLQITAAILLLIPRTAVLGALIYFPIILNICILSLAVRFDGSLISAPLMVLSNLFLLCWYYDKLKFIFPFNYAEKRMEMKSVISNRFPVKFFAAVIAVIVLTGFVVTNMYEIKPRNTFKDCLQQIRHSKKPKAVFNFCVCIHQQGQPLDSCLEVYDNAKEEMEKVHQQKTGSH